MTNLICSTCKTKYSVDEPRWKCDCGGLLDIDFKPEFDRDKIKSRPPSLWRYREAIPIDNNENIISFHEGFTPLVDLDINGIPVKVKMDHLFPSGSFKDRGASVLISKVRKLGIQHVAVDSSGNSGAAIATYSAKAGITCDVYVPDSTSPGKLLQIEAMGARLHRVPGSRTDTARAALKATEQIYYASHAWNPFFFQGTKTIAYEICEQLGWKAPDVFFAPVSNGSLILGAFIGFADLVQAGIIEKSPRLIGVQAAHCAPCADAFLKGADHISPIDQKTTIAEGIAVAEPTRGHQILNAVRHTGGDFITVTEAEIKTWLARLYKKGFYVEPTSAAVFAGIAKYTPLTKKELAVSVFTGHGLKSTKKV